MEDNQRLPAFRDISEEDEKYLRSWKTAKVTRSKERLRNLFGRDYPLDVSEIPDTEKSLPTGSVLPEGNKE